MRKLWILFVIKDKTYKPMSFKVVSEVEDKTHIIYNVLVAQIPFRIKFHKRSKGIIYEHGQYNMYGCQIKYSVYYTCNKKLIQEKYLEIIRK